MYPTSSSLSSSPLAPLTLSQALAYQPPPPLARHKRRSLSTLRARTDEGHVGIDNDQSHVQNCSTNSRSSCTGVNPSMESSYYAPSASSTLARPRVGDSVPVPPASVHSRAGAPGGPGESAAAQTQVLAAAMSTTTRLSTPVLTKSTIENTKTVPFVRPSRSSSLFLQPPRISVPAVSAKPSLEIPLRSTSLPRNRTEKMDSEEFKVGMKESQRVVSPRSTVLTPRQPEMVKAYSASVERSTRFPTTPSLNRPGAMLSLESEIGNDAKSEQQPNLSELELQLRKPELLQAKATYDTQIVEATQLQVHRQRQLPLVVPVIPLDQIKAQLLASRVQVEEEAVQLARRRVLRRTVSASKKTKRRSLLADIWETEVGTEGGGTDAVGAAARTGAGTVKNRNRRSM
ncbi:hypothetical protein HDU82_006222 [Entophlyctis luteolus]|nr:hypothetical protein HDU82_006222 [Entophlyctis luteolus]